MPDSPCSAETKPDVEPTPVTQKRGHRAELVFLACCLFAVIWGFKIGVVDRYGSDIPNWDQWDAEGDQIFLPYLRGELTIGDLFRPHNEHRIVLTRLLGLGLLLVNGQWDSRLECAVGAAIHALSAVAWFLFGWNTLRGSWRTAWLIAVAALVAPPHAWKNVTSGFASQQYLLLGLSTIAIGLMATRISGSRGWWLGLICAVLTLFTMASGFLTAAAILIAYGTMALRHRGILAGRRNTLLACGAIVLVGALLYESFSGHANLKAASIGEFLLAFWRHLQWPATLHPLFPLLAWLPFAALMVQLFRAKASPDAREFALFTAGIWVLLQFAATAYGRGANAPFPASRYLDTNLIGIGVGALSGMLLLSRHSIAERHRGTRACTFGIWIGVVALSLWTHLSDVMNNRLPSLGRTMEAREANTRAYLWTGDRAHLAGQNIPYPSAATLIERLEPAEIRAILPASIRPPLPLQGNAEPPEAFVLGGVPEKLTGLSAVVVQKSWGSFNVARTGSWTSAPFTAGRGRRLRFHAAGEAGTGESSIVVTPTDGAPARRFFATHLSASRWSRLHVRSSGEPLVLTATDHDPDGWIAFSPPVEVASLSYWTERACRRGFTFATLAFIAATLYLVLDSRKRAIDRAAIPSTAAATEQ